MGNCMTCVTTPKSRVTQGDANTPKNRCVTTATPIGGGVVVMLRHLFVRRVVYKLVSMFPFLSNGEPRALVATSCCRSLTFFARDEAMLGMGLARTIYVRFRASWGLPTMIRIVGVL